MNKLKKRINYVGYHVRGNQGDEALYNINRTIFSKYDFELLPVDSANEEQYGQVTLIGGGSIVPVCISWTRPTKYVYVFGAGVLDPLFYGYEPLLIDRLRRINFRFFGVRGNISKAFLENWGIRSEVIGDPCLSLKPRAARSKDRSRVGINIGAGFKGGSWGSQKQVLKEMAKVCRILKNEGYDLVLIPFWTENVPEISELSKSENINVFDDWADIEATLQLISECGIFIGEKLHSIVFSAAANTPFISLAYAPEHFDFLESIGFSKYSIRTSDVKAEKVMTLIDDLTNNYERMQRELVTRVNEYRERQGQFVARMVSDIESLPENKWNARVDSKTRILWDTDTFLFRNTYKLWKVWNRLFFLHVMGYVV